MTLLERYQSLLNRPWKMGPRILDEQIVDTVDHLPLFREVARGSIVEIGVGAGNSTTAFLLGVKENGGHVFSVDIRAECGRVHEGDPDWTFVCQDSRNASINRRADVPHWIDILFIDGDHSYEGANRDLEFYGPEVRPGGLILVHDVEHPEFPGVRRAFDEYDCCREKVIRGGSWGLGIIRV